MKERPTIVDIAHVLGISDTTVSRALRNDKRISQATRQRVIAQAKEMGYVPNALARGLARRETRTVGIVLPDMRVSLHFPRLVSAIEAALVGLGYVTYLCCTDGNPAAEAEALHMLQQKRVDGVILVPVEGFQNNSQQICNLVEMHIPVVFADRYIPGINIPCVTTDNRDGAFSATEHLLQLGHRRIGYIQVQTESSSLSDRFHGYRQALQAHGIPFSEALTPICRPDETAVREAVISLFQQPAPPTALFAPNEGVLVDALFELQSLGVRVPDELSVVAFDEPHRAVGLFRRITHLQQPVDHIGRQCVQLLAHLMNSAATAQDSAAHILLKPHLCILDSTAPPCEQPFKLPS